SKPRPAVIISVSMARIPGQISAHVIRTGARARSHGSFPTLLVAHWVSRSPDEARLASDTARTLPESFSRTSPAILAFGSRPRSQRQSPIGGTAYGRRSTGSYAGRKYS